MSDDSQESGSTEQLSDHHSTPVASTEAPATDSAQPSEGSVTIRSYLAEQFGVREVATPVQRSAPVAPPTDANAELAKWRERVPKLASALRERTEQIGLLESELARLQDDANSAAGAGVKARDAHIADLEHKLEGLTSSYQASEGKLRATQLELEDARSDLLATKQRWQELTQTLDLQVADNNAVQAELEAAGERAAALQAELQASAVELDQAQSAVAEKNVSNAQQAEQLSEQSEKLQELEAQVTTADARNEKLLETTELANRQLESLSQDISRLQGELVSKEQQAAAQLAQQQQLGLLETAQIQAEHSERLRDIHAQTLLVFEALERQNLDEQALAVAQMQCAVEQTFAAQEQQLVCDHLAEYQALEQAAGGLMQQVTQLQNQVRYLEQLQVDATSEQRATQQRVANEHRLELANITMAFEAQVQMLEQRQQQSEQVVPAQPRVTIIGEISDANEGRSDFAQAWSSLEDHPHDSAAETIRELERLLQIRGEELKAALASRVHFLPAASQVGPDQLPGASSVDSAPALDDTAPDNAQPESIESLRAQMSNVRAENERLRQQLERTSAALLASDDLTQLKGVGGKLAEQLRELGISQFAQMAALDLAELESPDHPLFNLRSRIERNGWIEQAKALVNPLTLYGER